MRAFEDDYELVLDKLQISDNKLMIIAPSRVQCLHMLQP